MTAIISGRELAADIQRNVHTQIKQNGLAPCLVVILVGNDAASEIYVRNKAVAASRTGIHARTVHLPASVEQWRLMKLIVQLNEDDEVNGILLQLPLPPHLCKDEILIAIDPAKDVDGFHPHNVGRMTTGRSALVPCTAKGIMHLLHASQTPLDGAQALVVGMSAIVGRPVSTLLTQALATVTCAHKQTRDLAAETRRADVIIVAAGSPGLIRGDAIKPGAMIIDVGINRLTDGKICGDVAFDECLGIAGAITPVPGGVGPMTIAALMDNTMEASFRQRRNKT